MRSFGLLRTNVGLTTNIKVMVDTNYKLSLDSIDSDVNLSFDKFKKVSFTKDNYYDELIPYFYKDLPADIAFTIKYDNDSESMSDDFKNQYDEIYNYGARNIVNNKNYTEEYEYFAPLYITKNGLPKKFIVFRVDGSGIGNLRKDNFKSEILKKLKTVKIFDLTKESVLGEWIGKNFTDNKYFPDSPLDIDFRNLEFCRWNGIDYQNGGYTYKSLFIDDILDEEKEIYELEKFVFDSYKNNKVVFPNILNFSFLFDDTPSTPELKRKWSINRYYGFYLEDLEFVTSISPYLPIGLQSDIQLLPGNVLYSATSSNPFVQDWSDEKPFYVEYNGTYYKVEQFTETTTNQLVKVNNPLSTAESRTKKDLGFRTSKNSINNDVIKKSVTTNTKSAVEEFGDVIVTKYRLISDLDLSGLTASSLNQNFGQIDNTNRLIRDNNINFEISTFDDQDSNIGVWLIEIDGIYHNLIKDGTSLKLSTDYSFTFNQNDFSYKVAGKSTKVSTVVDFNNVPKKFPIYRVKFTDIKDFDTRIVDTEFSKYEYEEYDKITKTDETKMYLENILSNSSPIDLDDFIYKDEVVNIPVSSEYTANYETFKIDTELSEIWRKNSVYCRWGFQKSLSANDMPYLLNNSLIFEDFNRTANIMDPFPKRVERNLDYFYTINSATSSYLHHTLHVENVDNGNIDTNFRFSLEKYLNFGTFSHDYFTYLFSKKSSFLNDKIQKNTTKYSYFNVGDESVPNHTLFRGLRFDIYEVDGVSLNSNNQIDKINIKSSNKFNDYKFSILLSDNDYQPIFATNSNQIIGLTQSINDLQWKVLKEWRIDTQYSSDDIVIYHDMLFVLSGSQSKNSPVAKIGDKLVSSNPITQGFQFYSETSSYKTIFWNPNVSKTYVYNSGEYYHSSNGNVDFWNPSIAYQIGGIVFFKAKYYSSLLDDNRYNPLESVGWNEISALPDGKVCKWILIEAWNPKKNYNFDSYTIYNNEVYYLPTSLTIPLQESLKQKNNSNISRSPMETSSWIKQSSDTTSNYTFNSIIELNDSYYLCNSIKPISTLDNNIIIYINKKWKNILININIADNTYTNISETNRDDLYDILYKKLTALNFTNAINDITNKYGFSDYISYIITEEDGTTKKYGYQFYDSVYQLQTNGIIRKIENIKDLPYLIRCEEADKLDVKVDSLIKRAVQLPNTLNPFRKLNDGKVIDLTQLNYYNNIPVAANIIESQFEPKVFENYHGNKNIVTNDIYRYSGYYTPIFYDIQLFERNEFDLGNYKFDLSLTDFGLIKERKVRKINRKGSQLRLANLNDEKSIYPMLDEFGYSVYDFFIFSSTWDLKYYLETSQLSKSNNYLERYTIDENVVNNLQDVNIPTLIPTDIGQIQNNN